MPYFQPISNYTNSCLYCSREFTEANPCWNDDGCTSDGELHRDGECKACAELAGHVDKRPEFTFDGEVAY